MPQAAHLGVPKEDPAQEHLVGLVFSVPLHVLKALPGVITECRGGRGRRRREGEEEREEGGGGGGKGGGRGRRGRREGEENEFRWDGLARQTTQVAWSINLSAITFTDCMPDEAHDGQNLALK